MGTSWLGIHIFWIEVKLSCFKEKEIICSDWGKSKEKFMIWKLNGELSSCTPVDDGTK